MVKKIQNTVSWNKERLVSKSSSKY